ncbi:helix-turn-helix domain-containing protein [Novosphingobium cyanobacteriorum]|uniref:Helix-turn-helix domain-containing protein n=1 Tax=Novosphingobium cyanobacteriorum TaxID=3024215 RepID=A0ABT6CM17_9SPHN|nr:helix-turn-helix domain-containing protein [Novosphingobium cyanobacteriorum]MDF8334902.1 helix-turn-helix domain-containing protein [Novosphingobium cyanobacteriorum]
MTRGLEGKSVKSARRVLEVLEYFSSGPTEATVMEMARALDYPQSSTSELLSSLVTLGYLNHDRHRRTFRPTVRVAAIGSGVGADVFRRGAILDLVEDVHEETGAVVIVGMAQRGVLHHVHMAGCTHPVRERSPGPMLHSALGQALLGAMTDTEVRRLLHRLNADAEPGEVVVASAYIEKLNVIRQRGYALAPTRDGQLMLARNVPFAQPDPLAIGVILPVAERESRHKDVLESLNGAFRRHLSPTPSARQGRMEIAAALS